MTITQSIATLERLVNTSDGMVQRRYVMELRAHLAVLNNGGESFSFTAQEHAWFSTAYAEAQLKRELESE